MWADTSEAASVGRLPAPLRTTPGTPFVVALVFGILLRSLKVVRPSVLNGIDAFGLMMLSIMILVFGPLATVEPADVAALAGPLVICFVYGVAGIFLVAAAVGKLVGSTIPMSVSIGPTALFGFPGTMIPSQEAAKSAGETPEEVTAIEGEILPKMIVAGFSTVTITSVIVTSIITGAIGR